MYSPTTGKARVGYRPSKKSIKRMVEKVHALTDRAGSCSPLARVSAKVGNPPRAEPGRRYQGSEFMHQLHPPPVRLIVTVIVDTPSDRGSASLSKSNSCWEPYRPSSNRRTQIQLTRIACRCEHTPPPLGAASARGSLRTPRRREADSNSRSHRKGRPLEACKTGSRTRLAFRACLSRHGLEPATNDPL